MILYKDDIVKFLVDADSSIPITNVLSFEEKNHRSKTSQRVKTNNIK